MPIRHGDHPNDELRLRNTDYIKRTRKNDSIDAAQNAPPHHTNDQDSDVSLMKDTDEEIDTADIGEINDFLRPERNENERSKVARNNNEWIKTAKDKEDWKNMENKFAMAAAAPGNG